MSFWFAFKTQEFRYHQKPNQTPTYHPDSSSPLLFSKARPLSRGFFLGVNPHRARARAPKTHRRTPKPTRRVARMAEAPSARSPASAPAAAFRRTPRGGPWPSPPARHERHGTDGAHRESTSGANCGRVSEGAEFLGVPRQNRPNVLLSSWFRFKTYQERETLEKGTPILVAMVSGKASWTVDGLDAMQVDVIQS